MTYKLRGDGPFKARSASDKTDDWPFWFVCGPDGINCLTFPHAPGAVFTERARAEDIAKDANGAALGRRYERAKDAA